MRSNRSVMLFAASTAALALLTLTGCGGGSKEPPAAGEPTPSGRGATGVSAPPKPAAVSSIKVADSALGRILVDESGRTLYGFTKDKRGASECDADCIAVWPALTTDKDITAGPGARAALLKETRLGEGADQTVYGDWPLYYYVGDATPGDVNGQGLDGEWFAIAADGKLIKKTT
ncbi:COG4315 family predicted lipoprotein [Streptomyces sp. NPDC004726]